MKTWFDIKSTEEWVDVSEIPAMISDANELVCLQESNDEPNIGFCGKRGSGKSFFMHSIIDQGFWSTENKKNIFIINDNNMETLTWEKPNPDNKHAELLAKYNMYPKPLPMVYCLPRQDSPLSEDFLNISLPPKLVFESTADFMGLSERSASRHYFEKISKRLTRCTSLTEIEDVIDSIGVGKGKEEVKSAITSRLYPIFNERVIDNESISNLYIRPSRSIYKPKLFFVINSLLYAGLIPSLLTRNLQGRFYWKQFIATIAKAVFDAKQEDEYLKRQSVWIVVDELQEILKDSKPVQRTFDTISARGRPLKIGKLWATQNYSKISPVIKNNTIYLFALRHSHAAEVQEIGADYSLPDRITRQILSLKRFEAIALTNEEFVCYDESGNRYKTDEAIKGVAIPPLSWHKKPGDVV